MLPLIPVGLMVDQVLPSSDHIAIVTSPRQTSASCPDCGVTSERLHSRYLRRLSDLPWQGRPVTLQVQARRFRCLNPACSRQTFAERLSGTAPAAARRTERLGDLQCHLGLAAGRRSRHALGREAGHADQRGHAAAARMQGRR